MVSGSWSDHFHVRVGFALKLGGSLEGELEVIAEFESCAPAVDGAPLDTHTV